MKQPEILKAIKPVISAFEALSIPYYIGGSIASSIYGVARTTMDIDMVAQIKTEHIDSLEKQLHNEFYIDRNMIKEALLRKTSFNLIHLETMIKIDVFIPKSEAFQDSIFNRKKIDKLDRDTFWFASPEDNILSKLRWYKMGNEVSEQQWLDILGIIKVQKNNLDKDYLLKWSEAIQVKDLIIKAFKEAGFK